MRSWAEQHHHLVSWPTWLCIFFLGHSWWAPSCPLVLKCQISPPEYISFPPSLLKMIRSRIGMLVSRRKSWNGLSSLQVLALILSSTNWILFLSQMIPRTQNNTIWCKSTKSNVNQNWICTKCFLIFTKYFWIFSNFLLYLNSKETQDNTI